MYARHNSITHKVLTALVNSGNRRLTGAEISQIISVPLEQVNQRTPNMAARGIVSRNKLPGDRCGFFHYYLTPEQYSSARARYEFGPPPDEAVVTLVVDTVDIPQRLALLKRINESVSVFAGNAVLKAMIGDYERTLALRNKISDSRDDAWL
jgi:hypothetical protein